MISSIGSQDEIGNLSNAGYKYVSKDKMRSVEKVRNYRVRETKGDCSWQKTTTLVSFVRTETKLECFYCKQAHPFYKCASFLRLSTDDRIAVVRQRRLSLNCFTGSYRAFQCKARNCLK